MAIHAAAPTALQCERKEWKLGTNYNHINKRKTNKQKHKPSTKQQPTEKGLHSPLQTTLIGIAVFVLGVLFACSVFWSPLTFFQLSRFREIWHIQKFNTHPRSLLGQLELESLARTAHLYLYGIFLAYLYFFTAPTILSFTFNLQYEMVCTPLTVSHPYFRLLSASFHF